MGPLAARAVSDWDAGAMLADRKGELVIGDDSKGKNEASSCFFCGIMLIAEDDEPTKDALRAESDGPAENATACAARVAATRNFMMYVSLNNWRWIKCGAQPAYS